jgi:excisionase family DNA binding protein
VDSSKYVRECLDGESKIHMFAVAPAPGEGKPETMTTEIFRVRDRGRAHRYREAAQVLNCSERHIIRLVRSGKLKADRLGARVVRIFDDELDRFVANARNGE